MLEPLHVVGNADLCLFAVAAVSMWDSELMESQKKLGDIASDVRRIQVAQKELDTNLDTIFAYQMELKSTLEVSSEQETSKHFT